MINFIVEKKLILKQILTSIYINNTVLLIHN